MKKYALVLEQHRIELDGFKQEKTANGGTRNVSLKHFFEPGKELVTDFDFSSWVTAGVLEELPYVAPRAPQQARRATREEVAAALAAKAKAAPAPVKAALAVEAPKVVAPKVAEQKTVTPAKGPKGYGKKNKR